MPDDFFIIRIVLKVFSTREKSIRCRPNPCCWPKRESFMKQQPRNRYRLLMMLRLLLKLGPIKALRSLRGIWYYCNDFDILKGQELSSARVFAFGKQYPCLEERFAESGSASGHYFHQDLLVARRICANNPVTHVDVGSRIDGFVAHVASFRSIEVFDIRPLFNIIPNIKFRQTDLMAPVDETLENYCDSLSCLHALEHFGLGRYGDPVNYDGYILGLNNLSKILKKGGKLYLSIPIGPQRIEFNAHRVFSVSFLLECLSGKYALDQFSFVDDQGELHENVTITDKDLKKNFDCRYGCGIFEMTKI